MERSRKSRPIKKNGFWMKKLCLFEKTKLQMPNSYKNGLKFDDEVQLKKKPCPFNKIFLQKEA